jgi:hypothetical protein
MRGCASAEGVPMANDLDDGANGDFKEMQDALLSTESAEEFLHEMPDSPLVSSAAGFPAV